jgi:hypothetical protein
VVCKTTTLNVGCAIRISIGLTYSPAPPREKIEVQLGCESRDTISNDANQLGNASAFPVGGEMRW